MEQRERRWKLLSAANGVLTLVGVITLPAAIDQLVPSLIGWSNLVHGLIALYRSVIDPVFTLLPFELPSLAQDCLVMISTIIITLNVESWVHERRLFIPSLLSKAARQVYLSTVGVFQNPRYRNSEGIVQSRLFNPLALVEDVAEGGKKVEAGCLFFCLLLLIGYLGNFGTAALVSFGLTGGVTWLAFAWPVLVGVALLGWLVATVVAASQKYARGEAVKTEISTEEMNRVFYSRPPWRQSLDRVLYLFFAVLIGLPVAIAAFVIVPIVNSWKSVTVVAGAFVGLLLLNAILVRWIDPWLSSF